MLLRIILLRLATYLFSYRQEEEPSVFSYIKPSFNEVDRYIKVVYVVYTSARFDYRDMHLVSDVSYECRSVCTWRVQVLCVVDRSAMKTKRKVAMVSCRLMLGLLRLGDASYFLSRPFLNRRSNIGWRGQAYSRLGRWIPEDGQEISELSGNS